MILSERSLIKFDFLSHSGPRAVPWGRSVIVLVAVAVLVAVPLETVVSVMVAVTDVVALSVVVTEDIVGGVVISVVLIVAGAVVAVVEALIVAVAVAVAVVVVLIESITVTGPNVSSSILLFIKSGIIKAEAEASKKAHPTYESLTIQCTAQNVNC